MYKEDYTVKNMEDLSEISVDQIKNFHLKMTEYDCTTINPLADNKDPVGNKEVLSLLIKKELGIKPTDPLSADGNYVLEQLESINACEEPDRYVAAVNNIKSIGAEVKKDKGKPEKKDEEKKNNGVETPASSGDPSSSGAITPRKSESKSDGSEKKEEKKDEKNDAKNEKTNEVKKDVTPSTPTSTTPKGSTSTPTTSTSSSSTSAPEPVKATSKTVSVTTQSSSSTSKIILIIISVILLIGGAAYFYISRSSSTPSPSPSTV